MFSWYLEENFSRCLSKRREFAAGIEASIENGGRSIPPFKGKRKSGVEPGQGNSTPFPPLGRGMVGKGINHIRPQPGGARN